ncbi:hypothetical protein Tco_0958874 [Tanacetum coccineum]
MPANTIILPSQQTTKKMIKEEALFNMPIFSPSHVLVSLNEFPALTATSGESFVPFQHPLLMEPSSSRAISTRETDNDSDGHLERNLESSSSRLDSIFHTLRNGRQGQHGH